MNRVSIAPTTRVAVLCFLGAASALIAADGLWPVPSARALEPSAEGDRHVVQSDELRVIMRRMEFLIYDRIQSDLELDKERFRQADEIVATAGELAATAGAISDTSTYTALDDAARRRFDDFAAELQREAVELQRLAREGQFAASAVQFERMSHACAGCHSLYRSR